MLAARDDRRAPARGSGDAPRRLPDRRRRRSRLGLLVCGLAPRPLRAARATWLEAGPQPPRPRARPARPRLRCRLPGRALGGLVRRSSEIAATLTTRTAQGRPVRFQLLVPP